MNDPWKRLAELERKGASEAWERAAVVSRLIEDEEWSTRDIASRGRELGIRSVASSAVVTRLHGWHRLIDAARALLPTGSTPPERAVRPVTAAGLPLLTQVQVLEAGLVDGQIDKAKLERAVHVARSELDHLWDDDQRRRQAAVIARTTVVANQQTDLGLIAWARANDCFEAVDRTSKWGNPFILGEDGNRQQVIESYAEHYLPWKRITDEEIGRLVGGVVFGCWCYPEPCHGDALLELIVDMAHP